MDSLVQMCSFVKSYMFRSGNAMIRRQVKKCSIQNLMFYVRSHSVAIFLFYKKTVKSHMVDNSWTVIVRLF